jgi:acyl-CoA reductase-like NAD-dependent aldehyde dehydrogenase
MGLEEANLVYTPVDQIGEVVKKLKTAFASRKTLPFAYRKQQLDALGRLLKENKEALLEALKKDLRKLRSEGDFAEISGTISEIYEFYDHVEEWARPTILPNDPSNAGDVTMIRNEPRGTVLIIGAWNYPIGLILQPLVGAIAAGCTAVIKPSEVSSHSAKILGELFPKYMDQEAYVVVQGAVDETTELLKHSWDLIFYTGNSSVGKVVMAAAAKHLTPVVLELGGKCPAIVSDNSDLDVLAKRLLTGRLINMGQTCVCIDYVLCSPATRDKLIPKMKLVLEKWYGDAKNSPDLGRIVNARHWNRVMGYLKQSKGKIVIGGDGDEKDLFIAPTVVIDCDDSEPLMNEEIFGPVLPIKTVNNLDDAIAFVNARPDPLALYVFSKDRKEVDHVLDNTRSGGVTVNDSFLHIVSPSLPFGGVGNSGMGHYHGKYSFETFVHKRSTLIKSQSGEFMNELVRYPPYSEKKAKWLAALLFKTRPNRLPRISIPWKNLMIIGLTGALIASSKPEWVDKLMTTFRLKGKQNDQ